MSRPTPRAARFVIAAIETDHLSRNAGTACRADKRRVVWEARRQRPEAAADSGDRPRAA